MLRSLVAVLAFAGLTATEPAVRITGACTHGDVDVEPHGERELRIALTASGCWAPALIVPAETREVTLRTWRLAPIRARVAVPRGETAPASVTLRLDSADFRESVTCTRDGAQWSCPAPDATFDARIAAEGFAPHYLFGVKGGGSFGELRLTRGASISGRVAMPVRDADAAGATVVLVPAAEAPTQADAHRNAAHTRTARADARGFFQFTAVETGAYEIVARKSGWSPSPPEEIDVRDMGETALAKSLQLAPLVSFELTVDPARNADDQPWLVRLQRASRLHGLSPVAESMANADGRWELPDLEAGLYRLAILGPGGSTFEDRIIDIAPDAGRLAIRLEQFEVHGTVTHAGKPLQAWLKLTTGRGKETRLRADEEGKFRGTIPEEGRWLVEVMPHGRTRGVRVAPIELGRSNRGPVEIELPEGRLAGKLVDEQGRSIVGNLIVFHRDHVVLSDRTTPDGTFEFIGIPTGEVLVQARAEGADSGKRPHQVSGPDDEPVTIVVPRQRVVRGSIVSPAGRPVAGASIRYHTASGGGWRYAVSDPAGEFALRVPPHDTVVKVVVVAGAFAVKMVALPAVAEPQTIRLAPMPATLVLRDLAFPPPFIRGNDVTALLDLLASSLYGAGPPRELTERGFVLQLEPGTYEICPDYATPPGECKAVSLEAGRTIEVGR